VRTATRDSGDWVLVTGATGFLGAALVAELLGRGRRVLCLVRAATPANARTRIADALRNWTRSVERLLETGRLAVLRGDVCQAHAGLNDPLRATLRGRVAALVHAAASTRFTATGNGEPERTNVTGTRHVLELAQELECRDWHLISTAYVAGVVDEAREVAGLAPPLFRNAYERSKWDAERLAESEARAGRAALTIYRPSIVVGHSATGRATRFTGIYYLFRATSLVARAADQRPRTDRRAIPLRIPATPDGCPNLICVDDVAKAFGDLVDQAAAHGGVYHLTHPAPPTNAQIKRVLEQYYDIGGGGFTVGDGSAATRATPCDDVSSPFQGLFDAMTRPLRDYLFDAPRFDRTQVERFVRRPPAAWTDDRLRRLIAAADTAGWRSIGSDRQSDVDAGEIAAYFREYLPQTMADSAFSRVGPLDLAVRFEIGRRPEGRWWCRFRGRCDMKVEPAGEQPWDVTYRTSESRFWAAVAGEITGAELFLSGDAQIEGDIERALKFAVMLEELVHRYPYHKGDAAPPAGVPQPQ
jgi:nucleoside-diphosphate-sugar epimerase